MVFDFGGKSGNYFYIKVHNGNSRKKTVVKPVSYTFKIECLLLPITKIKKKRKLNNKFSSWGENKLVKLYSKNKRLRDTLRNWPFLD